MQRIFGGLLLALALSAPSGGRAEGIQDILKQADQWNADLKQIDAALTDPDPDKRIAALNAIATSGVPAYIDKAMSVALLSDDPRLRQAALRARITDGASFRVDVDLSEQGKEITDAAGWLRGNQGSISADGKTGYIAVPIGSFNEQLCLLGPPVVEHLRPSPRRRAGLLQLAECGRRPVDAR